MSLRIWSCKSLPVQAEPEYDSISEGRFKEHKMLLRNDYDL
ncbi:MAG: hypothetical protein ACLSU9_10755 [Anaerovoracaceae bacterium]